MDIGQVVFSKSGRDKGKAFVIINIEDNYLYLVDGKLRTLNKPKKKKLKHVQPVNCVATLTTNGRGLQNADIQKELKRLLLDLTSREVGYVGTR